MSDVCDGRVWKDMYAINRNVSLTLPNNLCLALNVDWFDPCKQTPYSARVIYLSILNLPRAERFKPHNMIPAGIIPGPHEPTDLNPFLQPFVKCLKQLYERLFITSDSKRVKIRAMLTCITCDLPATRKVCRFSNFNVFKGVRKMS